MSNGGTALLNPPYRHRQSVSGELDWRGRGNETEGNPFSSSSSSREENSESFPLNLFLSTCSKLKQHYVIFISRVY